MAFDVNNPADLTALKNEVANDPAGMGYDVNANETELLALLNDVANNTTPETGVPTLTADSLMSVLWTETTATQLEFSLGLLFSMSGDPGADISRHRASIIAQANVGLTNAIEALSRDFNRAEVLFSTTDANGIDEYVNISASDWHAARDS